MMIPHILTLQNIALYRRSALAASVAILSCMGCQVYPFPLTVTSHPASAQPEVCYKLYKTAAPTLKNWQSQYPKLDAIYIGPFYSKEEALFIGEFLETLSYPHPYLIFDPAIAENSGLYPYFDETILPIVRQICMHADLIMPNYSEAHLLLQQDIPKDIPSSRDILSVCQKLTDLGPQQIVITSLPTLNDELKNVSYDNETMTFEEAVTIKIDYEDALSKEIFTSVLIGSILQDQPLHRSIGKATEFLTDCLRSAHLYNTSANEGLPFELHLASLVRT